MKLQMRTELHAPKKKIGRPSTRQDSNRTENLQVRLSPEEHQNLKMLAAQNKTTMSDIVYAKLALMINTRPNQVEGSLLIHSESICQVISKEEAKQILKSLTDQLLA